MFVPNGKDLHIHDYETGKAISLWRIPKEYDVQGAKFIVQKNWIVLRHATGFLVCPVDGLNPPLHHSCCGAREPPFDKLQAADLPSLPIIKEEKMCTPRIAVHQSLPYLLSGSGHIVLWDWDRNWEKTSFKGHSRSVTDVIFHPADPRVFASASYDGTVKVWSTESNSAVRTLRAPNMRRVNRIQFCTGLLNQKKKKLLVSTTNGLEPFARVWDYENSVCIAKLGEGRVRHGIIGAFSYPTLPYIFTASREGGIKAWRKSNYKLVSSHWPCQRAGGTLSGGPGQGAGSVVAVTPCQNCNVFVMALRGAFLVVEVRMTGVGEEGHPEPLQGESVSESGSDSVSQSALGPVYEPQQVSAMSQENQPLQGGGDSLSAEHEMIDLRTDSPLDVMGERGQVLDRENERQVLRESLCSVLKGDGEEEDGEEEEGQRSKVEIEPEKEIEGQTGAHVRLHRKRRKKALDDLGEESLSAIITAAHEPISTSLNAMRSGSTPVSGVHSTSRDAIDQSREATFKKEKEEVQVRMWRSTPSTGGGDVDTNTPNRLHNDTGHERMLASRKVVDELESRASKVKIEPREPREEEIVRQTGVQKEGQVQRSTPSTAGGDIDKNRSLRDTERERMPASGKDVDKLEGRAGKVKIEPPADSEEEIVGQCGVHVELHRKEAPTDLREKGPKKNKESGTVKRVLQLEKVIRDLKEGRAAAAKELEESKRRIEELQTALSKEVSNRRITNDSRVRLVKRVLDLREGKERLTGTLKRLRVRYREVEQRLEKQLGVSEVRVFSLEELEDATNGFHANRKCDIGDLCGSFYRGRLSDGTPLLIKKVTAANMQRMDAVTFKMAVVDRVRTLRHPHLLTLLGACYERNYLVYRHDAKGTVKDWMVPGGGDVEMRRSEVLSWYVRFRVMVEVSRALFFLQSNVLPSGKPFIHRLIKPANVLLDHNFVAKIGGVEHALLSAQQFADSSGGGGGGGGIATSTSHCGGNHSLGAFLLDSNSQYMAPECFRSKVFDEKTDIFALGITILEMLTGKFWDARETVEGAMEDPATFEKILDPKAGCWNVELAREVAKLGLSCASLDRRNRPSMMASDVGILPVLEGVARKAELKTSGGSEEGTS
ncbi:hypothetical protein CBR_g36505 [Chara braunii]|uniref:Protein kinase domain-containing protein n=1 Tax=Chara braunii TaxID=69332 RepID=A0A388LKY4_CHABU|nr:hypothetical protein CBR_g36505 [Chara braunii]|eukprot:GBG82979.1 hypothetical protein CBR_g36505 [Chara braunii]